MPDAHKSPNWVEIIGKVTTPIGLFTLVCLIAYSILIALSVRATEANQTLLVGGMIVALLLIVGMVFFLAVSRNHQGVLTGTVEISRVRAFTGMDLTANDIRFMLVARRSHGRVAREGFPNALVGEQIMPFEERAGKLVKLGLLKKASPAYFLMTEDGKVLADFFARILRDFTGTEAPMLFD